MWAMASTSTVTVMVWAALTCRIMRSVSAVCHVHVESWSAGERAERLTGGEAKRWRCEVGEEERRREREREYQTVLGRRPSANRPA